MHQYGLRYPRVTLGLQTSLTFYNYAES